MTTLPRPTVQQQPTWSKAIAQPATEFAKTPLTLIEGQVPAGLRGTLYRNGPGRLQRSGEPVGHWFDGDGAILAVALAEGTATATYRYVRTSQFATEELADRFLYSGYGMTAPGPLWKRWTTPLKNAANTSVLPLGDRLLALWEGGNPHALDLDSLRTLGRDDLAGALAGNAAYSAHPKVDPATGDIYNFGVAPGLNASLTLYRSDRDGRVQQTAQISLEGTPLIHDFALAGPYLLFCAPPTRIDLIPVGLGLKPFGDSIQWRPDLGTQIIVVDKQTLEVVSKETADPWFQWHVSNAYLEGKSGHLVLDVIRYADFATNDYLREVATGAVRTRTKGTYWRICIDPQTGRVLSQTELIDQSCEFPVVDPQQVGQAADAVYLTLHRSGEAAYSDMFGAIAKYDFGTGDLVLADCGEQRYPSEPLYAKDADSQRGWVLTVVFDGNQEQSELWIFAADALCDGPVARLGLPQVIPPSFHGRWQPKASPSG
ncbi:MAG: carotenoid oxygenase family protein [Cyanobacteria bacterium P01_A01_bin.135]